MVRVRRQMHDSDEKDDDLRPDFLRKRINFGR